MMSSSTMKLPRDRSRRDGKPVPPRQSFLLFLQGAFAARHGGYIAPAGREALQHFMEGQYAVDAGRIAVTNKADAQAFIDRVERGEWPKSRAANAGGAVG